MHGSVQWEGDTARREKRKKAGMKERERERELKCLFNLEKTNYKIRFNNKKMKPQQEEPVRTDVRK